MKLPYGNLSLEVSPTASPEECKEAYESFGRLWGFLPEISSKEECEYCGSKKHTGEGCIYS